MGSKTNEVLIAGLIITLLSILFYLWGFSINNEHLYEWAREVGGAGLVTVLIGLLKKFI